MPAAARVHTAEPAGTRVDRRKARTRAALISAAQELFARGGVDWSIQEITDAADVGFGSFYNHFQSKSELFDAAIAEIMEVHAVWLDRLLADEADPVVVFSSSTRLTARLPVLHPQMARVLGHGTRRLLESDRGLAPRALRDIQAGIDAGRFHVDDVVVALACIAGSLIAVLTIAMDKDEETIGAMADELARNVLRMLGVSDEEARAVVARPLPQDLSGLPD